MAKMYYVNGLQKHQAKKVCEFFFGEYFSGIDMNEREGCFYIRIKKSIKINDKEVPVEQFLDLADFKEYWGKNWKLVYETAA